VSARLAAIGAALALAGCVGSCHESCTGRQDGHDRGAARQAVDERPLAPASPARPDTGHASMLGSRPDLPGVQPRWHVTVPGAPAATALEHVAGPVIVAGSGPGAGAGSGAGSGPETGPAGSRDALVLVTSSAAGVVAIAADTGEVRWQRAGEQAPGLPIVTAGSAEVWLPGRCAHRMHEAQPLFAPGASADGQEREPVLGCVDIVDRAGSARQRVWIRAGEDAPAADPGRSGALGRLGENLVWGHGHDLLEIAMPAGRLLAHRRVPISDSEAGAGPAAIQGWIEVGPELVAATATGLAGFAACPVRGVCLPAWRLSWPRAVGVSGPVRAGTNVAWVRDQILEAGSGGRVAWVAPGFHAYAPGSLISTDEGSLLALRLSSDGIQPVRIEPASGRAVENGTAVPGAQVLAAAPWGAGLAAVVRLDVSLRHDVVIAWDERLNARWAWPVPEPARPRVEPMGLVALPAGAGGGVVVFHDGRFLARLPSPAL
jgi:hypothetical protein